MEKTFDLILENKGKTGCIQVVFNGIDSSNLRIPGILNGENLLTSENITNNQQTNSTSPSNNNTVNSNVTANEDANPPALTNQMQTNNAQLMQNLSAGLPSGLEFK